MTEPEYEAIAAPFPLPPMWRCRGAVGCGALVIGKGDHTAFHEDVDPRTRTET